MATKILLLLFVTCLTSVAAFTQLPISAKHVLSLDSKGRCISRHALRASASAAPNDAAAQGAETKEIDRFHSKMFKSESPVVVSTFVGDQGFEKEFLSELQYWQRVKKGIEEEFTTFKKSQEALLEVAETKLEDAKGKKESFGFLPFVDFEGEIRKATAQVSALRTTFERILSLISTVQVDAIRKGLEERSQRCFTEMQVAEFNFNRAVAMARRSSGDDFKYGASGPFTA